MKKLLITICCFYFLNLNAQILDSNIFPISLKNKALIENINNYCDEYNYKGKYNWIVTLEYFQFGDISFFIIFTEESLGSLLVNPPLFYFELDNKLVIVRSNLNKFITIPPESLDYLCKRAYPDSYRLYISEGTIDGGWIHDNQKPWLLIFKGDSLIEKDIQRLFSKEYLMNKLQNLYLK